MIRVVRRKSAGVMRLALFSLHMCGVLLLRTDIVHFVRLVHIQTDVTIDRPIGFAFCFGPVACLSVKISKTRRD